MRYIGLDAGSVSVKAVVLAGPDEGSFGAMLASDYRAHRGHPFQAALALLKDLVSPGGPYSISVTGSAGRLLADAIAAEAVNEIVAQALATRRLHPHLRSVIEMGGEDSKLLVLGERGVEDFAMNSVCAAGTGSFLDQQAERLGLTMEEFGRVAEACKKPPRVAGRCSVFAKSDMIHLQQIATPVGDIVAGLCFAVARNFKGSILRGRLIEGPVGFQGGVAANPGMRRAFKEVLGLDELFVPEEFALMGAIGAALRQMEEGRVTLLDLHALESAVCREASKTDGHMPLLAEGDWFHDRHIKDSRDKLHPIPHAVHPPGKIPAYLGIDIGSISTNLAVIDSNGHLLAKRYLMTAGRPIEAVRRGLLEIESEVGASVGIKGLGTTGSGRYMIADFLGADIVKNEITAQATAAAFIDPTVDTIFEIGGQDSKYIHLRDGAIVDFEMNKACAAGTGSFLEEQAEKLSVSVKDEFQQLALNSSCPTKLGERCTVFMENSLMSNLQQGAAMDDLLAGLSYSIVQNYLNRVVAGKPVGKRIFFQGGVAFNKSVVAAFEKHLGREITVPENHDVTGAIGMALIAMRHMTAGGTCPPSTFAGFSRARASYEVTSFECAGCPNLCEINCVKVEGDERKLFYGGRCEKYDMARKDRAALPPDLFKYRDELLWAEVKKPKGGRPVIGIPYVFYFNEMLPLWARLLDGLGFDIMVSPRPDRRIIDMGLQSAISEACFPVKVSLGHIKHLLDAGVDAVLCPSVVNLAPASNGNHANGHLNSLACPHTQTLPYVARAAFPGSLIIAPVVNLRMGTGHMASGIARSLKRFGVSRARAKAAIKSGLEAQEAFHRRLKEKGSETLAALDGRAVVIVGRPYNAFERGMNLQIPEKLATLGVQAIPMDMLPTESEGIAEHWPSMYWHSGQNILKAARMIARDPRLYPIFIGNFSCGPDSFILKFFKEELGGKPFLHIEIDEHSADAGAITRCEAFLDSIGNEAMEPPIKKHAPVKKASLRDRKVFIPRMSDHAFALEAAFLRAGIEAEVLPESSREAVELGMKHVSGKECYPCVVTTGDMLLKAHSKDFEPSRSAFFMPSGSGPCRFGQYNVFHQSVLHKAGFQNVPVFAPNQDSEFYRELGEVGKGFALDIFKGVVAVTLLQKCLHESRPYEIEPGSADALYSLDLKRIMASASGRNGHMEDALSEVRKDFGALALHRPVRRKPLIGIVGEIFVRSNRFSNENLVRKIEALGGEVWLASVDEWVYYVNAIGLRHALANRDWQSLFECFLKKFAMDYTERGYGRRFEGFLDTLHEPTSRELMRMASPYVDDSFEGETVLSIGKAVDLHARGASGIVNAMPFGCMPGTIVTALMRAVGRDLNIPCISVPYDGTESTSSSLQLEAFMDQARSLANSHGT